MKAIVYTASVPRYLLVRALGKRAPLGLLPLRLRMIPDPEPPVGWEKGKVLLSGICGSDLALLFGKSSPRLAPFFSFPRGFGARDRGRGGRRARGDQSPFDLPGAGPPPLSGLRERRGRPLPKRGRGESRPGNARVPPGLAGRMG